MSSNSSIDDQVPAILCPFIPPPHGNDAELEAHCQRVDNAVQAAAALEGQGELNEFARACIRLDPVRYDNYFHSKYEDDQRPRSPSPVTRWMDEAYLFPKCCRWVGNEHHANNHFKAEAQPSTSATIFANLLDRQSALEDELMDYRSHLSEFV